VPEDPLQNKFLPLVSVEFTVHETIDTQMQYESVPFVKP